MGGDFSFLKEYLDEKFETIGKRLEKVEECQIETSASLQGMNTTLSRLTDTVELHELRSTTLEKEFAPVRKEFLTKKTIEEYKNTKRKELTKKLTFWGSVVSLITGSAFFNSFFSSIWDKIKEFFR